ncbi:hypothetical protein BKA69DRAFT_782254 [Paraphysoderma sedebokerense]|nr:hypothetical protein BKA69DRAFT_781964 [Paraphysoderma sedebokerense]KAI9138319.1 hypothetical protein BKA69DRAFT_782254 [Paraphysoderma sedebokerense]
MMSISKLTLVVVLLSVTVTFSSSLGIQKPLLKSSLSSPPTASSIQGHATADDKFAIPNLPPFFMHLRINSEKCQSTVRSLIADPATNKSISQCHHSSPFFSTPEFLCNSTCVDSLITVSKAINSSCAQPIVDYAPHNQYSVYRTWANEKATKAACKPFNVTIDGFETNQYAVELAYFSYNNYFFDPNRTTDKHFDKKKYTNVLCTEWNRLYWNPQYIQPIGVQPLIYYWSMGEGRSYRNDIEEVCGKTFWNKEVKVVPVDTQLSEHTQGARGVKSHPFVERKTPLSQDDLKAGRGNVKASREQFLV